MIKLFRNIIGFYIDNKLRTACTNAGEDIACHFADVSRMVFGAEKSGTPF